MAYKAGPLISPAMFERLQPLFELGGNTPYLDHFVPPDVSLDSYLYYRQLRCEVIGKEWQASAAVCGRTG